MLRKTATWLGTVGLLGGLLSCTALPQTGGPDREGAIDTQPLPSSDVVPLEWGPLVSVTEAPKMATSSLLWFQDESGSVRIVGFNHATRELWPSARLIRRR